LIRTVSASKAHTSSVWGFTGRGEGIALATGNSGAGLKLGIATILGGRPSASAQGMGIARAFLIAWGLHLGGWAVLAVATCVFIRQLGLGGQPACQTEAQYT